MHGIEIPALPARAIVLALISGVLGIAVADTLYFRALNTLGAGRMGIVGNFYSPFVIVLSFVLLGERLNALQLVGFALVSGGVLIVSSHDPQQRLSAWRLRRGAAYRRHRGIPDGVRDRDGQARARRTAAALDRAAASDRRRRRHAGAVRLAARTVAVRPPPGNGHLRWPLLVLAAFLGQYVSMVLWMAGYKYTEASIAAVLNETASVFIVLLAALFLHEGLDARRLVGVACTLSGVACMLFA